LIKSLRPQIEAVFNEAAPIAPAKRSSYPLIQKLHGPSFDFKKVIRGSLSYDPKGNLLFSPGDYVIPVITYCMKQGGTSPSGHIYSLSTLEGTRAGVVRELNLRAPPKFSVQDIQIVSWSLQAGLSYDEMTPISQKIIDEIIPKTKSQLKESFLEILEKRWNQVSNSSNGLLPNFYEASENLFDAFGEVGQKINEIQKFKKRLHEVGHDYSRLSELINIPTNFNKNEISNTSWSQISKNVYARFITDGHFQDIGFVQIRILPSGGTEGQKREVNSINDNKVAVDIGALIANPNSDPVQPLTFSPMYGFAGILVLPALVENPISATMILAAILTATTIDWDSFFNLYNLLKDLNDQQIKDQFKRGFSALQKEHDELEKPLKEAGIINGKTKETSTRPKNKVREYEKVGGDKELQQDFDKFPGNISIASNGIEYKTLPSGKKIVKRPKKAEKPPTLEVQPSDNDITLDPKIRIKVRYK